MTTKQKILTALSAKITGQTKAELLEATGASDSGLRGRLSELSYAGFVRNVGGSYVITGAGTKKLPSRVDS